jgi:thioredoxin 1
MSPAAAAPPRQTADDTSFNRLVLKAPLPTIALFTASWSEVCEPCRAAFERIGARYVGRVGLVTLDLDESRAVAESFGVLAAPTYLLFQGGEATAHGVGYMPEPLLELFFARAVSPGDSRGASWHPTEQQVEEALILPMLARWGWPAERQHQLTRRSGRARRGAVDILVAEREGGPPLMLFENKRLIRERSDLAAAADQALGYANSLGLATFAVADAASVWVYQVRERRALPAQEFTWLALERDDTALRELLQALGRG